MSYDVKDIYVMLAANTAQFDAAMLTSAGVAEDSSAVVVGAVTEMGAAVDATAVSMGNAWLDMEAADEEFLLSFMDMAAGIAESEATMVAAVTVGSTEMGGAQEKAAAKTVESGAVMRESMKLIAAEMGVSSEVMGAAMGGPELAIAGLAIITTAKLTEIAMAWEEGTAKIQEMTGESAGYADQLGQAFQNMGADSTQSAQTIIDAYGPVSGQLEYISGHALSVAESTELMAAATDLAEASGGKLSDTTAALVTALQTTGTPLEDVNQLVDTLFNISRATNVPITELVSQFDRLHSKLGPLVSGSSGMQEMGALLLDVESHGIPAGRGLQVVGSAFEHLIGSKDAVALMKSLGVNLYDANGQMRPMGDLLHDLIPKLSGMGDKQRHAAEDTLFGKGAWQQLDQTIVAGLPGLKKGEDAVGKVGTAADAAGIASNTTKGKWDTWMAAISTGASKVAGPIADFFLDVADTIGTKIPMILQSAGDAWDHYWNHVDNVHGGGVAAGAASALTTLPKPPSVAISGGSGLLNRFSGGPISGFASGGHPLDGTFMVGERGPELLTLGSGQGGTVTSHVNLPTLGGRGEHEGTRINIHVGQIVVQGSDNVRETAIAVRNELIDMARGRGVNSVFGAYA